jgi:2-polyprenyl-6-hydroxyphenyl methylase/3-demethylubiquinone-9 3-methyltransferase
MTANTARLAVDYEEVGRFTAIAEEWWQPDGKFAPLHKLNPARLAYIREQVCRHFERPHMTHQALAGLSVTDIGCGGGLLSEPIRRMGARVTGIDPGEENIKAAKIHAKQQDLAIDYQACRAEDLLASAEKFDVVISMEVLEHVPDMSAFVKVCAGLVKPGGIMLLATLNRTLKSYALAIIGAEYVMRWLPAGTHDWNKFITPDELSLAVKNAGLNVINVAGLSYNPLSDTWHLTNDTDVNYMLAARR